MTNKFCNRGYKRGAKRPRKTKMSIQESVIESVSFITRDASMLGECNTLIIILPNTIFGQNIAVSLFYQH